ncbi:unnamed protein product [Angiostrongylus costaricensis]|uniref:Arp2/3 complex 34 kDa subunit n=1 Tax=Angiostrongylus costaricensis TaxID=334426 RepID=A0A0R3PTH9_ANGCS|nr:unnamed protein product [Angiostrongylus costaricensis]
MNWLTHNPAGLKLNEPVNRALASFFQYHIHLWKSKCSDFNIFRLFIGKPQKVPSWVHSMLLTISIDFLVSSVEEPSAQHYFSVPYIGDSYPYGLKWDQIKHELFSSFLDS